MSGFKKIILCIRCNGGNYAWKLRMRAQGPLRFTPTKQSTPVPYANGREVSEAGLTVAINFVSSMLQRYKIDQNRHTLRNSPEANRGEGVHPIKPYPAVATLFYSIVIANQIKNLH